MGTPRSPSAYEDIKGIIDAARAAGGGTYWLATRGEAVHWRMRAYAYRKILRTLNNGDDGLGPLTFRNPVDGGEKGWGIPLVWVQAKGHLELAEGVEASITEAERAAIEKLGGGFDPNR